MTEYQSSALAQIIGGYIFPLAISALYFYKHKTNNYVKRTLVSCHGVVFVLASVYAVIASKHTSIHSFQTESYIFQAMLIAGVFSILYSVYRFNGSKLIHLVQVLNVAAAAIIWFVGAMTLSHDWL